MSENRRGGDFLTYTVYVCVTEGVQWRDTRPTVSLRSQLFIEVFLSQMSTVEWHDTPPQFYLRYAILFCLSFALWQSDKCFLLMERRLTCNIFVFESKEDKILIKCLQECKGHNARQFITEFMNKG